MDTHVYPLMLQYGKRDAGVSLALQQSFRYPAPLLSAEEVSRLDVSHSPSGVQHHLLMQSLHADVVPRAVSGISRGRKGLFQGDDISLYPAVMMKLFLKNA